jgi:hypothetical protein
VGKSEKYDSYVVRFKAERRLRVQVSSCEQRDRADRTITIPVRDAKCEVYQRRVKWSEVTLIEGRILYGTFRFAILESTVRVPLVFSMFSIFYFTVPVRTT